MFETLLLQATLLISHQVVTTTTTTPAPLVERDEITISFGPDSFEQYTVAHVSTPWAHNPMIMVVPLGFSAAWYESTDSYFDSLAAILAYLGTDLWIMEQRRGTADTLPAFSCPSPFAPPGSPPAPVDCSAFGQWSVDDIIEDIGFVRGLIDSPKLPTIGGHWTGGMAAQAAVDAEPEAYSGAVLWEGTMYTEDLTTLGKNAGACAFLESIPDFFGASTAPGDEGFASFLAQSDPTGLSPFPQPVLDQFFLTAGVATNIEVLHAIFIVDNFALLDRVAEGLVFMVGTVEDGPDVADIVQVFNITNTAPAGTYSSLGILRGYACGLGGDPAHTSNLAAFEGDVLVIGSDRGMRTELQDTLDQFASANFAYSDFRGEFGVHDLLWSDLMQPIAIQIGLFNLFANL